jgi:N-acyl-D-aspartate/D-glutamate deacylase
VRLRLSDLSARPPISSESKAEGRLKPGYAANIAIFDLMTIGSSNRGERRQMMPSRGVEYTFVNGEVTWASGRTTGVTAGQVLRSEIKQDKSSRQRQSRRGT